LGVAGGRGPGIGRRRKAIGASSGSVNRRRLSQQSLAELTSARRPSVNAALRRLESRGLVARERRGTYRLFGEPPREVGELLDAADDAAYDDLIASHTDARGRALRRQLT
jgi:DNA-binding GntR family transcriptional regulator